MRKNKLFSSLIAAAALSAFAVSAQASSVALDAPVSKTNWEVSGSLAHYSIEDLNSDVLQAGFSYAIRNPEGHFSIVPELTLGKGVNGESDGYTSAEIDTVLQIGARLVLHPTETFDVYLNPTYRKVTADLSAGSDKADISSDWAFGVGVGVGANITNDLNLSLTFDRTKLDFGYGLDDIDTDVVTGKVSYRF
jgi:hypothetical protein